MKIFGRTVGRDRLKSSSTVVAGVTVPAVLAALAIIHPGVKVAEVDLNDGAVWVTRDSNLQLGRWDSRLKTLNAGVGATIQGFDVLQDAQDVLLAEPGKLSVVDPASVLLTTQAEMPLESQVSMAASVISVVSPEGKVWIRTMTSLSTIDAESSADLELAPGARASVTPDGVVLSFDPKDGSVHRTDVSGGTASSSAPVVLEDAAGVVPDMVTSVGEELVVLKGATLHGEGWTADLSSYGGSPTLQLPSGESDDVLVATRTDLLVVDLTDGSVERLPSGGEGAPARPAALGGCVFEAWATSTGSWLTRCGDGEVQRADLDSLTPESKPVFRVNRSVIALNDTANGNVWSLDDPPELQVANWSEIEQKPDPDDGEETNNQSEEEQPEMAECTDESAPPAANDDAFGVRAGRTTMLPVLSNDVAGDCGIIAVSVLDTSEVPESFGRIEKIHSGQALQITTSPEATGSVTFTYSIADGKGQGPSPSATVTLTANDMSVNSEPVALREGSMVVEAGATVESDALANFIDPDGDDLVLVAATTEGSGTVRSRQDGMVTFTADAAALGKQTIDLLVSDGVHTTPGVINVDVRAPGSVPPKVDRIHMTTYADVPVVVDVLAKSHSASAEPVRLSSVEATLGTTIDQDLEAGTFTFKASTPQTYYVPVTVVAPPQSVRALVRIDVVEKPTEPLPPVAVRDVVFLPALGEVVAEPLVNDSDAAGNVLVVTSIELSEETALKAAVVDHRYVRISSQRQLEAPETIRYTISNGTLEATGEILVVPIPVSPDQRAPVVEDITTSVRTGGVVTVAVLDHAYDPDGDVIELVPELPEPVAESDGLLFASGDLLRFQASENPGTVQTSFTVRDTAGNKTTARLTINVHESNPEKDPPRPKALTARTFDGETVRIMVPLTGIDKDGDGVTLLGQGNTAPKLGRIGAVGADSLEYEAFPGSFGTDVFTYAVEDWTGQRAEATIRVGISARSTVAQPILARDDEITVQPGKRVEVRVMRNDVDPSGGELTLLDELEPYDDISAKVEGRRVVVETPKTAGGTYAVRYTVTNALGSRASAVLTVHVVDDATILPPVARDVVVAPIEVVEKSSVEVDVFELAENPSGPLSELAASIPASHAAVAQVTAGNKVLVTLTDKAQTIPYLLTNMNPDAKGVKSYAFIVVPAKGDFRPVLRPKARELRVASGAELIIPLAEFVQVGTGKTARIADTSTVSATKWDGSGLVVDDGTLRYVSVAGYAGPASITFEVLDSPAGDPTGRRSVLTLPITVFTEEDYPPSFAAPTVEVPQGESIPVDLLSFTRGTQGSAGEQKYTYAVSSQPTNGFQASIAPGTSRLTVSAPVDLAQGTLGSVGITIGYGRSTKEVKVDVKATASSKLLAKLVNHEVEGQAGKDVSVDLLAGSINPFPEAPLVVLSVTPEPADAGTAKLAGSTVTVRPAAGFVGTMTVRYRVRDFTGEPRREVDATVKVVVRDIPDAPAAPRIGEVSSQTVLLSWDAPNAKGSPITGYRVTRYPGNQTTTCPTTACTITGLTNGTEYSFTVAAENSVGWSAESQMSARVKPDAVPDVPRAPTLHAGDTSAQVTWEAPANEGTPITEYTVQLSSGETRRLSGLSAEFSGLVNGTGYTARVRAHSAATPPEGGGWSPWSTSATPAGRPFAPTVYAERIETELGRQIRVAWTPPRDNGSPLQGYDVVGTSPGHPTLTQSVGADSTQVVFGDVVNGAKYTFSVAARNAVGVGDPGVSGATSTFAKPGRPVARGVTQVGARAFGDAQVTYSWAAPADTGGVGIGIVEYQVEGLGEVRSVTGTSVTIGGLRAGPAPGARVRAQNSEGVWGDFQELGSTAVTTVPDRPAVSVLKIDNDYGQVQVSWTSLSIPGADVKGYQYKSSNGETGSVGPGDTSMTLPSGKDGITVEVVAVNDDGKSLVGTATGKPEQPKIPSTPTLTVTQGTGKVTVSWARPNDFGSPVTSIWYVLRPPAGAAVVSDPFDKNATEVEIPITGHGNFVVEIYFRNGAGDSFSTKAFTVADPEPDPDPDPTIPGPGGG